MGAGPEGACVACRRWSPSSARRGRLRRARTPTQSVQRERVAGPGMEDVPEDHPMLLALPRLPALPADETVDGVGVLGLVQRQLVAPPLELVGPVLGAGWATGPAPDPGPRSPSPRRRSRRGARDRRLRTPAGRRPPRRPRRAGRRGRSRTARRSGCACLLRLWRRRSIQPCEQVVADAERVRHRREGRDSPRRSHGKTLVSTT